MSSAEILCNDTRFVGKSGTWQQPSIYAARLPHGRAGRCRHRHRPHVRIPTALAEPPTSARAPSPPSASASNSASRAESSKTSPVDPSPSPPSPTTPHRLHHPTRTTRRHPQHRSPTHDHHRHPPTEHRPTTSPSPNIHPMTTNTTTNQTTQPKQTSAQLNPGTDSGASDDRPGDHVEGCSAPALYYVEQLPNYYLDPASRVADGSDAAPKRSACRARSATTNSSP